MKIYQQGGMTEDMMALATKLAEAIAPFVQVYQEKVNEIDFALKEINETIIELRKDDSFFASNKRRELSEKIPSLKIERFKWVNLVKSSIGNLKGPVTVTDDFGFEHKEVADFRPIPVTKIDFSENDLSEAPPFIPEIELESFRASSFILDAIKIDKNTYIVSYFKFAINRPEYLVVSERIRSITKKENYFCLLTLDQLVITHHYYTEKQKRIYEEVAKEKRQRDIDRYFRMPETERNFYQQYKGLSATLRKKFTEAEWNAKTLEEKEKENLPVANYRGESIKSSFYGNSMPGSYHHMYSVFLDKSAFVTKRNYADQRVFDYFKYHRELINIKIKDFQVERIVLSDVRKAALETSFGESNTNDKLFEKYGILVKRQDGSNISEEYVSQIERGWKMCLNTFGDLRQYAKSVKLKISHTGEKRVFASKAIGMYIPSMGTIAVSNLGKTFDSTLFHEVGHMIDDAFSGSDRYMSSDFDSLAGRIAMDFRKSMNQKSESDYINSTVECFARAMQEYALLKNYGPDSYLRFGANGFYDEPKKVVLADEYVSLEKFEPISKNIDTLLEGLKSIYKLAAYIEENPDVIDTGKIDFEAVKEESDKETLSDLLEATNLALEFEPDAELISLKEATELALEFVN